MRQKILCIYLFLNLFIFCYAQYGADDTYLDNIENTFDYLPIYSPQTAFIADMVLIYQGGAARLPYTKQQIAPYVYKFNDQGGVDWLFDGFLFLEFRTWEGHAFIQEFFSREPNRARKQEWIKHLDRVFEDGKAVSALNDVILDLMQSGYDPPTRKRKVILSLPEPMSGQKDWGNIDGKELDFSIDADRLVALKWYIDEIIARFNNKNYKYIELAGFYWTKESDDLSERLVPSISEYVNEKEYILNWIPNWGPHRGENWKDRRFNSAYIQPNTFFSTGNSSNLPRVCTYASIHQMGLEVEFDHNLVNESYQQKLHDYFDNFEKYKVLEKSAIVYYEGGRHFLTTLSQANTPSLKALYTRLTDIIVERQRKVDQLFLEDQPEDSVIVNSIIKNGSFEKDFWPLRKPGSPVFGLSTYAEPARVENLFDAKTQPYWPKIDDVTTPVFDTEVGVWYLRNSTTYSYARLYIDVATKTEFGNRCLTFHNVGLSPHDTWDRNVSAHSPFHHVALQRVKLNNDETYTLRFSYHKSKEIAGPSNTTTKNFATRFVAGVVASNEPNEYSYIFDIPIPEDGDESWKEVDIKIDLPALIEADSTLDFSTAAIIFGLQTQEDPETALKYSMLPGQMSIDNVVLFSNNQPIIERGLKSLYVFPGNLTPAFSPDILSYSVEVENDTESITFTAEAKSDNAMVEVVGAKDSLKIGKNQFDIVVTSQNGVKMDIYSIEVIRREAEFIADPTLKSLTINGVIWNDLNQRFDMDTESELSLIIETNDPNAIVSIGNSYSETIKKPTLKEIPFTITSGDMSKDYNLLIERRYSFNEVVTVKWNNTLMANLKKIREDGFSVNSFQWFKNKIPIPGAKKAVYSAGPDKSDLLDKESMYYLELSTPNGKLRTSEVRLLLRSNLVFAYPTIVSRGEKVILEVDIEPVLLNGSRITVYDLNGTVYSTEFVKARRTVIDIPNSGGVYLINFYSERGFTRTLKVVSY